jgi:4-amino-4-deoxy-L-arabinose transferase-like glycosyltransferase
MEFISIKRVWYKMKLMKICTIMLLIIALSFILRISPIVYLELNDPGYHARNINEIEFYYDDVARSLIAGKGFVHSVNPRPETIKYHFEPGTPFSFVPPLYAWWLYIVYLIFGPNVFLAKIIQSMIDSSTCLLIYCIGKKIFKKNAISLLAASLYAVYPLAIITCSRLYYQIPMNVALCWMILCFMAPVTFKNGIWTGISVAISSLAKPVTLPLIAVMPIIRIVESFLEKNIFKKALLWSIALIIAAIATLTPWTVRNYIVFNKFVPIQYGAPEAFYLGSKEEYIDLDVMSIKKKYGDFGLARDQLAKTALYNHIDQLKKNPLDYTRFLGKKFFLSWYNTEGKTKNFYVLLVQIPYLLSAMLGLIFYFRFWTRKKNWYIPATVLYFCAVEVAIFPLVRYTLAVMPLFMLVAASGIYGVLTKWYDFRRKSNTQTVIKKD